MKYALVNATGIVVNVIEWDGVSPYDPAGAHTLVPSEAANIGDAYVDGVLVPTTGDA